MNSKILVDCGSNLGQGYEQIKSLEKIDSFWDIEMFEPSPECVKHLVSKYNTDNFNINNKAVYTSYGEKEFHFTQDLSGEVSYTSVGSKLGEVKHLFTNRNSLYSLSEPIIVETIDLSDFIDKLDYKYICLKLDVEGSEYDILRRMIETSSLKKINKLYVEFHNYAIDSDKKGEYDIIKTDILNYLKDNNVNFVEWH